MSDKFRGMNMLAGCVIALSLLLPGAVLAASAPGAAAPAGGTAPARAAAPAAPAATKPAAPKADAKADAKKDSELTEVVVTAEKPTRKPSVLITWIRRLLGEYTVDGKADLGGKGKPEERWTVTGKSTCIGFGVAPGVQCELNVRWPPVPGPNGPEVLSGVSDLTPAMILYAMEPDDLGIRYLQVNSKGLAEGGVGYIIGDTATFKTPCVNAPPGCVRVIRITSESESKILDMQIDTEINTVLAARFNFRMRRVAAPQAELAKDPPKAAQPAAAPATGAKPASNNKSPAEKK